MRHGFPLRGEAMAHSFLLGIRGSPVGLSFLAVHMIVSLYSQDAHITSAVCLDVYSASGSLVQSPRRPVSPSGRWQKATPISPSFSPTPPVFKGPAHEVLITALNFSMGFWAFPVVLEEHLTCKLFLCASGLVGLATIGTFWPHTPISIVGFPICGSGYLAKNLGARRAA